MKNVKVEEAIPSAGTIVLVSDNVSQCPAEGAARCWIFCHEPNDCIDAIYLAIEGPKA